MMKLNLMAGHVNSVETELISSSLCTGMRVFIQVIPHVLHMLLCARMG